MKRASIELFDVGNKSGERIKFCAYLSLQGHSISDVQMYHPVLKPATCINGTIYVYKVVLYQAYTGLHYVAKWANLKETEREDGQMWRPTKKSISLLLLSPSP